MTYWEAVLQEVLHRHDESYHFYFTNIRELEASYFSSLPTKSKSQRSTNGESRDKVMYMLGPKFEGIYLSEREINCLKALMAEPTNKAAAKRLDLSVRTIEYYVSSLKSKFNCASKTQLLDQLREHELFQA